MVGICYDVYRRPCIDVHGYCLQRPWKASVQVIASHPSSSPSISSLLFGIFWEVTELDDSQSDQAAEVALATMTFLIFVLT